MNLLPILSELSILCGLLVVLAMQLFRSRLAVVLATAAAGAMAMLVLGYPKSGYHALIALIGIYAVLPVHRSYVSSKFLLIPIGVSLSILAIHWISSSNISILSKYSTPKLFPLWFMALFFLPEKRGRLVATLIILVEIYLQNRVQARGLMLGAFTALAALYMPSTLTRRFAVPLAVSALVLYVAAFPIARAMGVERAIYSSASNMQRAGMNNAALMDTLKQPLTLDENAIFVSARPFAYSYDTASLTVHNLFLAFGLFNGLIVAFLLVAVTLLIVNTQTERRFIAISLFCFLYAMLGPDTAYTRVVLLILFSIGLLRQGGGEFVVGKRGGPQRQFVGAPRHEH
ncbi:hypothetical protein [Caulobacter segnis]|uniref:hypothetical protein n=1 Tax=Caulobacter segnis TaxID=88688 RepID=UPI001CBB23F6|nr:hypothetical protein [Caulobacter segnis]UAL08908.1 hypothetical protein K8940_13970 [Caulobacter segnis]